MKKYTKILLLLILLLAFFLRVYNFREFYIFSHDQDVASWVIKDILINKHIRLIGQETSSQGVFIGALFYYLQIPFYLIGRLNPLLSVFLPIILGVFAVYSVFFVIGRILNNKTGLLAAFIYAVSAYIVFVDREVVPTMPVMLWSVWYLYSLFLVFSGKQTKGFLLWGILLGLVWQINLALLILSPLILIPFLYTKKPDTKGLILGLASLILVSSPFLIFEYRHEFSQTKSIILSLTTKKDYVEHTAVGLAKLDRVMQLVNRNTIGIFSKHAFIRPSIFLWGLVGLFAYLAYKKKISPFLVVTLIAWQLIYVIFFSANSLNVSEYYFNGMNIIWILIMSLGLTQLLSKKQGKILYYLLLVLFLITNLNYIFTYNSDKKGYLEKMALIKRIKQDSTQHGYPCVSVSYIVNPGYDLGYRYLFWLEGMHVNRPKSLSPVYTIVYPHSLVDRIDEGFGSLGLIYPDYARYNEEGVQKSCQGENSNLTDPMFGYTQ